jgi:hypothetical protein
MPDPHPLTVIPAKAPITPGARFVLSFPSETLPEWVTICPWGTEGWLLAAVDDVPGLRDEDCRVRLPGAPAASVVRHGPWVVIPEAKLRAAQSLTPLDPQTTERVVGMFQELCAGWHRGRPG